MNNSDKAVLVILILSLLSQAVNLAAAGMARVTLKDLEVYDR